MRLLLDESVPIQLRSLLVGHDVDSKVPESVYSKGCL